MIIWRNLNVQNSVLLRVFREPGKKFAELGLKNTVLEGIKQ